MLIDLKPDEADVVTAIRRIRSGYIKKRTQLIKALGRKPTTEEMLSVAKADINIISNLHKLLESYKIRSSSHTVIPVSFLVQTFLTKITQGDILSSSTEESNHDQPE